ncbi:MULTISPECIES: hypothetical protein [unclassified Mesorhizobium]|uniref:hypothetical protein n=1 Tax=unclassified Mesorhizobium TaxID=325217 RepID=UPI0012EB3EB7|nr:hypothetical protein [Mesorhizobium sp. LSJC268A00]
MDIMTALATRQPRRHRPPQALLELLAAPVAQRKAIAITGAARSEHRLCPTSSALRLNSWLATPEFRDEAGHVGLRVANNARLTMMIVAKRAGMCPGMCRAG